MTRSRVDGSAVRAPWIPPAVFRAFSWILRMRVPAPPRSLVWGAGLAAVLVIHPPPCLALHRDVALAVDQGPGVVSDQGPALSEARRQTRPGENLAEIRRPTDDADLRYWLDNMVRIHRFTPAEVSAATGLTPAEVQKAIEALGLRAEEPTGRRPGDRLRVVPYPGGRHPRLGFLEGAILPQRETKISVFPPWEKGGYVVVDVPEAIFSNLGLTYLAHTHIATIWDQQGVKLPRQEWNRRPDGTLDFERALPNGIAFGTKVVPGPEGVRMELWLRNGTPAPLTGLRVQICILLGRAPGFESQTLTNRVFLPPYAAARSDDGRRWILTAWDPVQRCWGNDQCPCLHSDPQFPDCPPGETRRLRGWLSFYEGADLEGELKRVEAKGWRQVGTD